MPLSATVTGDAIEQDARANGFTFFTSYVSDPMPSEVGLAVLRLIASDRLAERAKTLGAYLLAALGELQQRYEAIGDVRGRGLLIGVELVVDRHSRRPAHELMQRVTNRWLELGLGSKSIGYALSFLRLPCRFLPGCDLPAVSETTLAGKLSGDGNLGFAESTSPREPDAPGLER